MNAYLKVFFQLVLLVLTIWTVNLLIFGEFRTPSIGEIAFVMAFSLMVDRERKSS